MNPGARMKLEFHPEIAAIDAQRIARENGLSFDQDGRGHLVIRTENESRSLAWARRYATEVRRRKQLRLVKYGKA